jgi:hypothetical protein
MNRKKLTILSGLCAVVLIAGAYVLTRTPGSGGSVETLGFGMIDANSVLSLTRTSSQGTVEVVRSESGWTLAGESISASSIDALLESFSKARATLVAKKGREVTAYGLVGSPMQIEIEASSGGPLTLDIGAPGPSAGSIYVARPDAPEVYLLEGTTLGEVAGQDWRGWRSATSTAPAPTSATP